MHIYMNLIRMNNKKGDCFQNSLQLVSLTNGQLYTDSLDSDGQQCKTTRLHDHKARYTRCKFCIQVSIQVSWIQVFWSCIPYKKLESKNLNGLGWNRNASYFFSTWMEPGWRLTNQKTESLSASICECK